MYLIAALALFFALKSPAQADASLASALCHSIERTGLVAEPCEVDDADATVRVRMRLARPEAIAFCEELASTIRKSAVRFGGPKGWKLEIRPAAGDMIRMAVCDLPR